MQLVTKRSEIMRLDKMLHWACSSTFLLPWSAEEGQIRVCYRIFNGGSSTQMISHKFEKNNCMFSEHSPKRLNLNPECRMNFIAWEASIVLNISLTCLMNKHLVRQSAKIQGICSAQVLHDNILYIASLMSVLFSASS